MKRLLLLFILSPVILLGQTRRKAIADSIKTAATDLQHISTLVSRPGTGVEKIDVSDSGEYITLTVRIRVTEAMAVLTSRPVAYLQTRDIVAGGASALSVPPMPPIVAAEPVTPLPPSAFFTAAIPVVNVHTLMVPPLPDVNPEPGALAAHTTPLYSVRAIAAVRADTLAVPAPPDIDILEDLTLSKAIDMAIAPVVAGRVDTMPPPDFEQKKMPVSGMHLSAEGYSLLEKLEGFSPVPYSLKDGGLTIGFGFFIPYSDVGKWKKGVTWEEAEVMIRQKVPGYEDQVKQYINVPLTQNDFDALTMLAYNLGGFAKATSIVNDINRSDFDKLQSDWKRFVHSKAPGVTNGLMHRRRDELGVRNESDYQPERKIQIFKN